MAAAIHLIVSTTSAEEEGCRTLVHGVIAAGLFQALLPLMGMILVYAKHLTLVVMNFTARSVEDVAGSPPPFCRRFIVLLKTTMFRIDVKWRPIAKEQQTSLRPNPQQEAEVDGWETNMFEAVKHVEGSSREEQKLLPARHFDALLAQCVLMAYTPLPRLRRP